MMAPQAVLSQPCGDQPNEAKPYQYRPARFPESGFARGGVGCDRRQCRQRRRAGPQVGRERRAGAKPRLPARRNQGGQGEVRKIPARTALCELHVLSGQTHRRMGQLCDLRQQASGRQGLVFGVREEGLTVSSIRRYAPVAPTPRSFMPLKFSVMITSVALAAILAGVWLADVSREHDSRAVLLPEQGSTVVID